MSKILLRIFLIVMIFISVCGCQPQEQDISSPVVEPETETLPVKDPIIEIVVQPEPTVPIEPEPTLEANEIQVDTEVQQPEPETKESEFYQRCDDLFKTYVDDNGNVNYKMLRRKRLELIKIVRFIEELDPAKLMVWSRNEKLAFWINTYNVLTIQCLIDNYPIKPRRFLFIYPDESIMQIPGAWDKKYFRIMGLEYTLREIEREILAKRFGDPRIFFALSYASKSSAFLRNEPYRPDSLDRQLDEQVEKFLKSTRGIKIDHNKKIVYLSDIFNWYKQTFLDSEYAKIKKFRDREPHIHAYLNFIANYIGPDDIKYVISKDYEIEFQMYDWHLNEQ